MINLQDISLPDGIKKLNKSELIELSNQLRQSILSTTSKNGGHLASNLGIVETTLALYNIFDFPDDKLIFDVGHQCYTHKILSGRRDKFPSIRVSGGLSGFPDSDESEYDVFTTGHAGTSVAQAIGLCKARDKLSKDFFVINVVGDGSLVNGLNLEALSESQTKPKNYILILNDNGMSISKNRNGFYKYISKVTAKQDYIKSKNAIKKVFGDSFITKTLKAVKNFIKRIIYKENYFERFGFKYIGIIDGNNLSEMTKILKRAKQVAKTKAVFLHIKTTKGKGYEKAEKQAEAYHGVGKHLVSISGDFGKALASSLCELKKQEDKVVAITAGMKEGTGLSLFEQEFSDSFYDVGIAEEFAVTFASGLAKGGLRPFVAIYSTFLQRAYDQIMLDVCLNNLPVVFCIDRAGFSGEDGKTHQGLYDLSYLSHIPNLIVLAPSTTKELDLCVKYAYSLNCPVAIRYPKNSASIVENETMPFSEGLWQTLYDGKDGAILVVGPNMVKLAIELKGKLKKDFAVVNCRTIKPIDKNTLKRFIGKTIITLEENSLIGGFNSLVKEYYANEEKTQVFSFGAVDSFIKHDSAYNQRIDCGLDVSNIIKRIEGKDEKVD